MYIYYKGENGLNRGIIGNKWKERYGISRLLNEIYYSGRKVMRAEDIILKEVNEIEKEIMKANLPAFEAMTRVSGRSGEVTIIELGRYQG